MCTCNRFKDVSVCGRSNMCCCVCSELRAIGEVSEGMTVSEAVIGDIYTQFTVAMKVFSSSRQVRGHTFAHLHI